MGARMFTDFRVYSFQCNPDAIFFHRVDESERMGERKRESEREKFSANVEYEFCFAILYAYRVWLTHLPHNRHTLTHAICLQRYGKRLRLGLHSSMRTRTQTHTHTRAHTHWIARFVHEWIVFNIVLVFVSTHSQCRIDDVAVVVVVVVVGGGVYTLIRSYWHDVFLLLLHFLLFFTSLLCVSASTMPRSTATAVAAVCDCVCFFASSISTRFLLTLQFCHSFRWYHFVHTIENAYLKKNNTQYQKQKKITSKITKQIRRTVSVSDFVTIYSRQK